MAHDEFEKIDPRKRQSLDQQAFDQSTQPLQQEHAPLGEQQSTARTKADQASLDTLPSRRNRWMLSGLIGVGALALAAAFGVPRLLPEGDVSSDAPSPAATDNASSGALEDAAITDQQATMLLEQAKLLAQDGGAEDLVEAIAIAKSIPAETEAYATAHDQVSLWNQQLLEARAAVANTPVDPGATNAPQNAQQQAELAELQRQIDQEVALASSARQQRQSAQTQISALQNQLTSQPGSASVQPAPVQPAPNETLIAARQELAQQQSQTQALRNQLTQAQNQTTALQNQQQELSQPTVQPTQQAQPPTRPQPQTQTQTGNSTPANPSDPYLNVDIAPPPAPQTVAAVPTTSAPVRGNSHGFNNVVVGAQTVAIELRDNVDEDGDFVTLLVNGQVITNYQQIWNRGQVFMVPLQPGENVVEIIGDKDGTGGITLEVNVAGIGNVNSRPIDEGSTASFIITRQ